MPTGCSYSDANAARDVPRRAAISFVLFIFYFLNRYWEIAGAAGGAG
jgi:hypothetical protein